MATRGRVSAWHEDEGWGVLESEETPGGCWAHFSAVRVEGYKVLAAGQEVLFVHEPCEQDGFAHRALAVWPADRQPVREAPETRDSPAYRSSLRLRFDEPEQP